MGRAAAVFGDIDRRALTRNTNRVQDARQLARRERDIDDGTLNLDNLTGGHGCTRLILAEPWASACVSEIAPEGAVAPSIRGRVNFVKTGTIIARKPLFVKFTGTYNRLYRTYNRDMPARDTYHLPVRRALEKAGWTITHDPYTLTFGQRDVFVDLGAERLLAAERAHEKIALEIKGFHSPSDIRDLENAIGQYTFYRALMRRSEPERKLYLAIPHSVMVSTIAEAIARPVIEDLHVALVSFDPQSEEIVQWTN